MEDWGIPVTRTRILALDPALSTGVADGRIGDTPWLTTWDLREAGNNSPEAVFARAARLLELRLTLERPDVLAIEMPVPPQRVAGRTQFATSQLTLGLYGLYTGMAGSARIRVVPVHMLTWRKAVLGRGRITRNAAKLAAVCTCQRLRWQAADDDQAEAACIWQWACGELRTGRLAGEAAA